jgi:hypothetical protein
VTKEHLSLLSQAFVSATTNKPPVGASKQCAMGNVVGFFVALE